MIFILIIIIFYLLWKNNKQKEILKIDILEIGDYVKMTPTNTNFNIETSKSGYSINQFINPSELNLWRVIKKNENGTIEVVSEFTSKEKIYFSGKIGYINFVANLNEIAAQYANEKYVLKTRHVGYNNQTEQITNSMNLENPKWDNSTIDNYNELIGGGDVLYENDYNLIQSSLKTMKAKNINQEETSYWISSRYFNYNNGNYSFNGRIIDIDGNLKESELITFNSLVGLNNQLSGFSIRPVLTLKKDINITSGDGKSVNTAYQLN